MITQQYVLSFENQLIKDNSVNASRVGSPHIPFFVLLKWLPDDPFDALADFKTIIEEAKKADCS